MSVETESVNRLVQRMEDVRNSGKVSAMNIQHEAQRLVDWKEHVKARPLLAVSICSIAGFVLVRTLAQGRRTWTPTPLTSSLSAAHASTDPVTVQSHWLQPLTQAARDLAISTAKNVLLTALKKYLVEGTGHDRLSHRTRATDAMDQTRNDSAARNWLD